MPSRDELPDTLTVPEVADMLGLADNTIRALAVGGQLRYVGETGSRHIDTDSLVEYVNKRFGK